MSVKTNAARILEKKRVQFELLTYEVDENNLSAVHIAHQKGLPVASVFKTLVLRGDRQGIFVCLIPATDEVDLKKAAKASGNKSCSLIHVKELLGLTGYIRGGCSPVGMKKQFPTYIHESCLQSDKIYISGGARGIQLKLSPADLIQVCQMTVAPLV